jgi:deoxyribonuclease-4
LIKLGVHVSITGTIDLAADRAKELELQTLQMFTRNPRGWKFKKLKKDEVNEFKRKIELYGLTPTVSHMPYLPNLSSPKKVIYNKSLRSLITELDRCAALGVPYVVTHLGSHLGKGPEIGLERIVTAINEALSEDKGNAILLLENTAGTRNSMGSTFEEINRILNGVETKDRVGVCFDTAHAFAAGYDLRTGEEVNRTIEKFDSAMGLRLLKLIHLNDSKGELGSGRDRHEHIGLGYIGEQGFRALLHHKAVRDLPFIMETPIDTRRDDVGNIRKARELSS